MQDAQAQDAAAQDAETPAPDAGDASSPTPDGGVGVGTACALAAERIRITEIDVGGAVANDEDEAALRPLVISARPSGGSRIAWMGTDKLLHLTTLDAQDKVSGSAFTLEVADFSDMIADDAGGVVLGARAAKGGGNLQCGTLTNLCGNANSLPMQFACWDMHMIRFDGSTETWATQLSESRTDNPPYLTSPTASGRVVYLWQAYAHHGRIAFDGTNYAAYYGAAISVSEQCVAADTTLPTGVNIHQGDRMDVVDSKGARVTNKGGFEWGCSHSGYERVLWDPTQARFVPVCKTDNNNRIALAPSYKTILPVDLAASNLGDLALADAGYWLAFSDAEAAKDGNADVSLVRFTVTGANVKVEQQVSVANQAGVNERAPHLAAYGSDGLLVAWETSDAKDDLRRTDKTRKLHIQARTKATGEARGQALMLDVLGNRYQSFRAFPDGSVAFVAPGSSAQRIKVARILPCAP
jgi:hypothetical protein